MSNRILKKLVLILSVGILVCGLTGCTARQKTQEIMSGVQVETSEQEISEPEAPETESVKEESLQEETSELNPGQDSVETKELAYGNPSTSGALHVEGTQLKDSKGNNIQLRGVSTHGLSWFPQYVNQQLFHELHDEWNANTVRLAMYTAENGGYCTDGNKEKLKQLVKDGVAYATNADMYVIVDWHVLRDEDPNVNKEEAKKFFDEMSKEFAESDNIIYEICNEPNGSTTWAQVKTYAEEVIPIIRNNDKDALIIVGTPTWCQDVDKAAADPITEYDNVMYALHFYATTHTDWLRDRMVQAVDSGLPIFVSEFGTCDASGNGAFDEYQSNEWIKLLNEKGISYITWNLSNKNETSSIFADGCSKISGFTQDDLSVNGKWVYQLLTGNHALKDAKTEEPASEEQDEQPQPVDSDISGKSKDFAYTAVVSGTWESEGKTFYQYSFELENISEKEIDGWEITVSFSGDIELSNGWNGDYTVSGNKLKIKALDYNAKVSPGQKVSDVGFIISGDADLKIKN